MKLIIGLGNPTPEFKNTRHNIGEHFVSELSKKYGGIFRKEGVLGDVSYIPLGDQDIILLFPLTYMNDSGFSVYATMKKHHLRLEDILVIYDDLDLPFNKIRFRKNGGSGGHNGVKSMINFLESEEFARIKFGIGRPESISIYDYVLSKFTLEEQNEINHSFLVVEQLIINWLG